MCYENTDEMDVYVDRARVRIAELEVALRWVKAWFAKLEDNTDPLDRALKRAREVTHAPIHAVIDAALAGVPGAKLEFDPSLEKAFRDVLMMAAHPLYQDAVRTLAVAIQLAVEDTLRNLGEAAAERHNRMEGERTARILRTECPLDAREALEMLLSAWEYVWRASDGNYAEAGSRSKLQGAAYDVQAGAGLSRRDASDIEAQVSQKWEARERLGIVTWPERGK